VRVTQEQYEAIAVAQVRELWSRYPGLTELWFDGGYRDTVKDQLAKVATIVISQSCLPVHSSSSQKD
jgi:hypothetical protein